MALTWDSAYVTTERKRVYLEVNKERPSDSEEYSETMLENSRQFIDCERESMFLNGMHNFETR